MNSERPGFNPEGSESTGQQVEYKGRSYEVRSFDRINEYQIEPGDRAFITTQSGNRYMLRRSRRNDNRLFAYKESDRFSTGGELDDETLARPLASVGSSLHFQIKNPSVRWDSTPVMAIEIRKGIDAAIEAKDESGNGGKSLGAALIDRAHGRK